MQVPILRASRGRGGYGRGIRGVSGLSLRRRMEIDLTDGVAFPAQLIEIILLNKQIYQEVTLTAHREIS